MANLTPEQIKKSQGFFKGFKKEVVDAVKLTLDEFNQGKGIKTKENKINLSKASIEKMKSGTDIRGNVKQNVIFDSTEKHSNVSAETQFDRYRKACELNAKPCEVVALGGLNTG